MRRLLLLVGAVVFVDTMFFAALTPLLPHYADELGLSKAGAGVLAAAYPAGALAGGVPSGIAAARLGVKPTVLVGLVSVAVTTVAFGLAESAWLLDTTRFLQGFGSAFTWTAAFAWLTAASPPERRGALIGSAMGAAIGGALFGPVVGAVAAAIGIPLAFSSVAAFAAVLAVWAGRTPAPPRRDAPQPLAALGHALTDGRVLGAVWFVSLPALLFGTLGVLASLRLDTLGFGAAAIGATFLTAAAFEAVLSPVLGHLSDRRGRLLLIRVSLVASAVVAALLPWPDHRWLLAPLVVLAGIAYGSFWSPAMSHLTDVADARGLDYGYGFALINIAWAPGQALGAAGGGALARATTDAVPYVLLAAACVATLLLVRQLRA